MFTSGSRVATGVFGHHQRICQSQGRGRGIRIGLRGHLQTAWPGVVMSEGMLRSSNCPLLFAMGDVDETAKLWKVNRTIHELVKDRVGQFRIVSFPPS